MLWKEEKKQELTNRKKEETMGKVFGYPEFDENGEQILTTYDNEYKDMLMDVRVYRMKAGDEKSFQKTGEETAVLLLSGSIEFESRSKGCFHRRTLVCACSNRI